MQKRTTALPATVFFLLFSLLILTIGQKAIVALSQFGSEQIWTFVQELSFSITPHLPGGDQGSDQQIETPGNAASDNAQKREMQALRDQFLTVAPQSKSLLPARIIGFQGYIPGASRPTQIVIDKGSKDGVKDGLAVVYKNNLVGRIVKTTPGRSLVSLLSKSDWSFTAKTSKTGANGLVSIDDGELLLKNVVLSDSLEKKDLVVTKGEEQIDGIGFPPDLVVGEILSIDKKASALFQSAKIKSFVDVTKLSTVFVAIP